MAAVTVEDCLKIIPNRFELTLIASERAKQLMNGAPALYDFDRGPEKNTVTALREIGADLLDTEKIREEIRSNIKNQSLFKSYDESVVYGNKKESDTDFSLTSELNDNFEDDGEFEESDDEEEDDDSYYDNIDDIADDTSEETDK